jgi:acyl-CoA thioesterase
MSQDEHPNRDRLDALFRGDAYARHLGVEVVDWGGGWSHVRYRAGHDHTNFGQIIHGGAMFSVGDVAFSIASNSWGRRAVALAIDTHFLAAINPGDVLEARATERSRTRRTASYAIEVDRDGEPAASLHAMVFRLEKWFFDESDWPEGWRRTH